MGNEYTAVTREVTFGPGQSTVDITIPIVDDTIPQEPDRDFTVMVVPGPSIITLPDTDATVTVFDDDGKSLLFDK